MPLSIFLKIDGISGEATAAGHAGEIMLQSFTWGSSAGTAPTGAGAGKISFQNAIVTKVVDKASPPLSRTYLRATRPAMHRDGRNDCSGIVDVPD